MRVIFRKGILLALEATTSGAMLSEDHEGYEAFFQSEDYISCIYGLESIEKAEDIVYKAALVGVIDLTNYDKVYIEHR